MNHALFNRALNWRPAPYRLQGRWTFDDFHGQQWPTFFPTKQAAEQMGLRHIEAVLKRAKNESN